ncbi:tRNA (cytidine(34)-2'-O)-methyltransferase [Myceligenerans cantabricum]
MPHPTDASPPPESPLAHVMYFEPRIPGNTGSAIRLAAVTGARLHLVEPLGFDLSEAKLKRAGLDYHDLAVMDVHPSFDAALEALPGSRVFAFTTRGTTRYTDVAYRPDDVLLFGPEPTGLPGDVLAHPRITDRLTIPMLSGRRSLNLTNAASIAVYEAWRQRDFAGSPGAA